MFTLLRRRHRHLSIINRLINRTTLNNMKIRRHFDPLPLRHHLRVGLLLPSRLLVRRLSSMRIRRRHRHRTRHRRRRRKINKFILRQSRRSRIRRRSSTKGGKRSRHLQKFRHPLVLPLIQRVNRRRARSRIHRHRNRRASKPLPNRLGQHSNRPKSRVTSHVFKRRTRNTISRNNNRLLKRHPTRRRNKRRRVTRVMPSNLRHRGTSLRSRARHRRPNRRGGTPRPSVLRPPFTRMDTVRRRRNNPLQRTSRIPSRRPKCLVRHRATPSVPSESPK